MESGEILPDYVSLHPGYGYVNVGCAMRTSAVARMQRSGIRGDAPGLRFTPSGLRLRNYAVSLNDGRWLNPGLQ